MKPLCQIALHAFNRTSQPVCLDSICKLDNSALKIFSETNFQRSRVGSKHQSTNASPSLQGLNFNYEVTCVKSTPPSAFEDHRSQTESRRKGRDRNWPKPANRGNGKTSGSRQSHSRWVQWLRYNHCPLNYAYVSFIQWIFVEQSNLTLPRCGQSFRR